MHGTPLGEVVCMSNRFEQPDEVGYLRVHDSESSGWVRDGVIGFRGFVNERDALRAAALCHALLTEWLDERPRSIRSAEGAGSVRSRGHVQWTIDDALYVSGQRVGRFLRPSPVRGVGSRSFGFELSLTAPSRQSALRLARRLHDTLAALQHPPDDEPLGPPDDAA
jgi:hypothetical protein